MSAKKTLPKKLKSETSEIQKFWMCYVIGGGGASHRHSSRAVAEKEAMRLAKTQGRATAVLECVSIAEPKEPPVSLLAPARAGSVGRPTKGENSYGDDVPF